MVRVNDELSLDAGICERDGPGVLIRPPQTTLFNQLLAYLLSKPDPPNRASDPTGRGTSIATAALVLRWGSYLSVLLDRDKPVCPQVHAKATSRISDEEMARINIEASAALAEWIDLYRSHQGGGLFEQLVDRAIFFLPMAKTKATADVIWPPFPVFATPDMAARVAQSAHADRLEQARAHAEAFPNRVFSNALVNTAWRNGPVELVHAGRTGCYPLDERRMTPREERGIMVHAMGGLAMGMTVCHQLTFETSGRTWPEQVLPYGLAKISQVTPHNWTLTESSRAVALMA